MQKTVGKPTTAIMEAHEKASKNTDEFLKSLYLSKTVDFKALSDLTKRETEALAETLREQYTNTLEKPINQRCSELLYIGFQCGEAGINITSITCDRQIFEQRKTEGAL